MRPDKAAKVVADAASAASAHMLEDRDQESEYRQRGQWPQPNQCKSPEWLGSRRRHMNGRRLHKRLRLDT
jgi:hypothetical protein